jgi:hypothetical protein
MCCDCLGLCRECLKPIESDKQDENKCDCEKLSAVQKLRKKKRQEYETYNQQRELPPKYEEFSRRLLSMDCNGNDVTIINDMLSVECCDILMNIAEGLRHDKRWEDIIFVDGVHNRKMIHFYWNGLRKGLGSEEIINPNSLPDEMKSLCNFIISGAGYNMNTKWFRCTFIRSDPPCDEQSLHVDDNELKIANRVVKNFRDISFNMIAAIDRNCETKIMVPTAPGATTTKPLVIPYRSICLFRCDFVHCGAAYLEKSCTRLFMSTGTDKFINDGENVGVV